MLRKLVTAFALLTGLLALGAPASPALAGGGPSDYVDCIVTATPIDANGNGQLDAGESVQVSGTGLQPNFTTDVIFDAGQPGQQIIGSVTTNAAGAFGPVTVIIPASAADGTHTISVACDSAALVVNGTDVPVGNPPGGEPNPPGGEPNPPGGTDGVVVGGVIVNRPGGVANRLPRTGNDVEPLVVAGGAALLAGITFVLIAKRRRRSSTAS